jgi:hypothetical protein
VSIEYHVKGDAAYFRTVRDRYYRQRPYLLRLTSQFSILGACLILPWVYAWVTDASWKDGAAFGILVGIVVSVGSLYLTKALILARLKGRGKNSEGTVTLSEQGVTGRGQHGQTLQYWASYPRAVRRRRRSVRTFGKSRGSCLQRRCWMAKRTAGCRGNWRYYASIPHETENSPQGRFADGLRGATRRR